MINKRLTLDYEDPNNFYQFITGHEDLTKVASESCKEITDFIRDLPLDIERYVYVLINAMGAEEFYGDNNNGDAFPEYYEGKPNLVADGPDYGYKTFQTNAKLFKHHKNKPGDRAYGDVLLAVYNHRMHRPELVVRIDRKKAPSAASRADSGEIISTSMGTKVPYDVCSVCGNKAKTTKSYCVHLKTMMGKVLPNGEKVYAINPRPKFFDISMVFVPADSTSRVMKKLASDKNAAKKSAAIEKHVPVGRVVASGVDNIVDTLINKRLGRMKDKEPTMSKERLDSISKKPLADILSTMAFSGIVPKPKEFQRIILMKMNKSSMADMLDENNITFDPSKFDDDGDVCRRVVVDPGRVSEGLFDEMSDMMPYRSMMQPRLLNRMVDRDLLFDNLPRSTTMNLNPLMSAISGMFRSYMHKAPKSIYSSLGSMMAQEGVAKPRLGKVVITISGPKGSSNIGGVGQFISSMLEKKFSSKNSVDFNPSNKLKYFLSKILGVMPGRQLVKEAAKAFIGIPLMGYDRTEKLELVKEASFTDSPGRRWIIDTLSDNDNGGFKKEASGEKLVNDINPETVELIHEDGDLLNVVTLAKLAKLV